jgi:hypothetical protein
MKKPHASTESGKPTKRESADEHQVNEGGHGCKTGAAEETSSEQETMPEGNIYIYIYF